MIQSSRFDLTIMPIDEIRILKRFCGNWSMVGRYCGQEFIPSI